jgi:hypothetical protein
MKVFLIIKLSEAPLSIRVLATLWHPVGILTMKDRFLSDNSMSEWSSGPNEMSIGPPHPSSWLNTLGQADLTLKLLPLRLGGEGHAVPEDNINLPHMLISVRIFPTMITSSRFL